MLKCLDLTIINMLSNSVLSDQIVKLMTQLNINLTIYIYIYIIYTYNMSKCLDKQFQT